MRLLITASSALALAVVLLAACSPLDTSAPAANSQAARANAPATNAATQNAPAQNATAQSPAAQQPAPVGAQVPAAAPDDGVARIKQEELTAGMQKGTVVVYDVRDKAAYDAGHIKGSKNVPWNEVETRLSEFPKDKQIVTYCA